MRTTIKTTPIRTRYHSFLLELSTYNRTSTELYSADFLSVNPTYSVASNGTLNLQLQKSYDYFNNSFYWNISDFVNYSG